MNEQQRKQLANGEALLAPDAKQGIDYRAYAKGRRTPTKIEALLHRCDDPSCMICR